MARITLRSLEDGVYAILRGAAQIGIVEKTGRLEYTAICGARSEKSVKPRSAALIACLPRVVGGNKEAAKVKSNATLKVV